MNERTLTLTERITFAEDWLGHARQQIQDGRTALGTLTLLMAEAELHRAREVARPRVAPRRSRMASWFAVGTLAAAAGVMLATYVMVPGGVQVAGGDAAPPIIRLSERTGQVLHMVRVPEPPIERTVVMKVVQPRVMRVAVPVYINRQPAVASADPVRRPPSPPAVATVAATSIPESVTPSVQAPRPAPGGAATQRLALTEAEVIDMVLAAERTLHQARGR